MSIALLDCQLISCTIVWRILISVSAHMCYLGIIHLSVWTWDLLINLQCAFVLLLCTMQLNILFGFVLALAYFVSISENISLKVISAPLGSMWIIEEDLMTWSFVSCFSMWQADKLSMCSPSVEHSPFLEC